MKKTQWHPEFGPIVLWHCRCSVWPIYIHQGRIARCGYCHVRPQPIPEWSDT